MLGIRRRLLRTNVTWVTMVALLWAQGALAVHSCTLQSVAAPMSTEISVAGSESAEPMPDCPGAVKQASAKVCASHCDAGSQVGVGDVAPVAHVFPQVALVVAVDVSAVPGHLAIAPLIARAGAPPASILFGRFLL